MTLNRNWIVLTVVEIKNCRKEKITSKEEKDPSHPKEKQRIILENQNFIETPKLNKKITQTRCFYII